MDFLSAAIGYCDCMGDAISQPFRCAGGIQPKAGTLRFTQCLQVGFSRFVMAVLPLQALAKMQSRGMHYRCQLQTVLECCRRLRPLLQCHPRQPHATPQRRLAGRHPQGYRQMLDGDFRFCGLHRHVCQKCPSFDIEGIVFQHQRERFFGPCIAIARILAGLFEQGDVQCRHAYSLMASMNSE